MCDWSVFYLVNYNHRSVHDIHYNLFICIGLAHSSNTVAQYICSKHICATFTNSKLEKINILGAVMYINHINLEWRLLI